MSARADAPRPVVVGASHRSSGAALRDRLFVPPSAVPAFLGGLRAANIGEALCLSTCARVEVQAAHADPDAVVRAVTGLFARRAGTTAGDIAPLLYARADAEAVRHVFRVAASLDSPVIGEPQILGDIKEAHRLAREAGMTGAALEALLQSAYAAAKRVRGETALGERPVTLAAVALGIARDIHGALERCAGLLLAGGDMGELVAERLRAGGLGRLTVAAPVPVRAESVARRLGCHHAPFEALPELLAGADVVVTALGTGSCALTRAETEAALARRRRAPIFVVDAAVPGDVEPAVNELDGAFLYDLDDLDRLALEGRQRRGAAAAAAETIVEDEVAAYLRQRAGRGAVPLVAALRGHFWAMRETVLREASGADAGEATRLLINRLLHAPSRSLRELAEAGEIEERDAERLIRALFGLDADDEAAKDQ